MSKIVGIVQEYDSNTTASHCPNTHGQHFDEYPVFDFKELMYCFSIHYALSIVMAVWLDTHSFVWPQNGNAFHNGLSL